MRKFYKKTRFSASACEPGHFRSSFSSRCFPCLVGEYSDTINDETSCTPCPMNTITAQEGSTSISQCNIGKSLIHTGKGVAPEVNFREPIS